MVIKVGRFFRKVEKAREVLGGGGEGYSVPHEQESREVHLDARVGGQFFLNSEAFDM
jgi:hypothetical protein